MSWKRKNRAGREPAHKGAAQSEQAPVSRPGGESVPPVQPVTPVAVVEPALPAPALPEEEARQVDMTWALAMVGLLTLVFALLAVFSGVSVPVLLALAVAYVLNPLVTRLERRGLARTHGTAIVFAGCALLMVGAVLYLVPVLRAQAVRLPELFGQASIRLLPHVERLLGVSLPELVHQRTAELGAEASDLLKSVGPTAARLVTAFASNTARLVATLLGLLLVPVLGFFFLSDWPELVGQIRALLPLRSAGLVGRRFAEVDAVLSAFVRGQLTVGSILAVLYSTGLSLARIEMALVIGAIAGFGNMVPYVGTAIGVVLSLLGVVLSWHGSWQLVVVAVTFLGCQLAEGLFITPRVVGDQVGLSSVTVIIAVLGFGELFGFTGVLLAVPTAAILKVVLRVVLDRYRRTAFYGGTEGPAA